MRQNIKYRSNDRSIGMKLLLLLVIVILIGGVVVSIFNRNVIDELPDLAVAAAIMIDAETGEVLYERNSSQALPPASMSKMMTELLVLDHVNNGSLNWNDPVITSAYASDVMGAQIGFGPDEQWTVRELFDAMTVHSANDAAVALAEHIGKSEKGFVSLMNKRAKEIGLSDRSVFGNSSGLSQVDLSRFSAASSERDTLLTSKDTAILARYLIKKYPQILEVTARASILLPSVKTKLQTTNLMLPGKTYAYPGNDGLKTGYTEQAGYCFTSTAKQGDRRLITVVMGTSTAESRFLETQKLLHFGFQTSILDMWLADMGAKFGLVVTAFRN
ncbi:MAG: D-alanyl-D-alanine carboxypeptidase family protein [Candidatus Pristimantibacillus sp.]